MGLRVTETSNQNDGPAYKPAHKALDQRRRDAASQQHSGTMPGKPAVQLRTSRNVLVTVVHGALTKAGRVKGMTPVVEKVGRLRKKSSGRARVRQRYNKRCAPKSRCIDVFQRYAQIRQRYAEPRPATTTVRTGPRYQCPLLTIPAQKPKRLKLKGENTATSVTECGLWEHSLAHQTRRQMASATLTVSLRPATLCIRTTSHPC